MRITYTCLVRPNRAASIVETDLEIDFAEPIGYKDSELAKQYERNKLSSRKDAEGGSSGSVIRTGGLQKAKLTSDNSPEASTFVAFSGTGKRIDGKGSSGPVSSTLSAAVASGTSVKTPAGTSPSTPQIATSYTSRIGDKYSKKKAGVSAFTGQANKLT
jgi:hypothetical protein